jgi:competence protein ComEC
VLLDAGSTSLLDLLRKCLAPYLRHRGHTAIDTIVISHANIDHFSAVAEAVSAYDVREVLVGPRFREHCADNPPAEWMLRELDRIERPPRVVLPGDTIPFGREAGIEILWPPPSGELPSNDASVVLKLRHGPRSILFCGDIQEDAMRALLRRPGALKADVLIAPHHGSSEASTRQFVEAVDPKVIISSNDRTLTQKQRRFEQLIGDRPLLRTHAAGAITVRMTRTGRMSIECFATGERIELAWE